TYLRKRPFKDLINIMAAGAWPAVSKPIDMDHWSDMQVIDVINFRFLVGFKERFGSRLDNELGNAMAELIKRANAKCTTVADYIFDFVHAHYHKFKGRQQILDEMPPDERWEFIESLIRKGPDAT